MNSPPNSPSSASRASPSCSPETAPPGESQLKAGQRIAAPPQSHRDQHRRSGRSRKLRLSRKAALTVVFAKEGVVTNSLALTDTGPNDLPVLRRTIEELAGTIPANPAELRELIAARLPSDPEALKKLAADQTMEIRRLQADLLRARQQARRPGMRRQSPPRTRDQGRPPSDQEISACQAPGQPPEDPELNTLLRSFIRKTNDDPRTDQIFAEIKPGLDRANPWEGETVEMFKLMLSFRDRYGTKHAQELAESFLETQGSGPKEE